MSDTVIKVENISKQYRLGNVGTGTLSHDLNRWWHRVRGKEDPYIKVTDANDRTQSPTFDLRPPTSDYVWALRDINFEVKRGEVLGIIGRNGAGKSTLLKILSRVTAPTEGCVKVKGRIGALLEVGTGFHPELTGRENIYLNGAILGMTKAEVTSRLDEIVCFSGCERYLDTPVKRYSSGMLVRLAFSVAAHLDPEILIVDEVLAVGDAQFQKKCLGKMDEVASQGRTVLIVSHNMASIGSLCSRVISLGDGRILHDGATREVVSSYLSSFDNNIDGVAVGHGGFSRNSDEDGLVRSVRIYNLNGVAISEIQSGQPFVFSLILESKQLVSNVIVGLHIEDDQGRRVTSLHTSYHPSPQINIENSTALNCKCEGLMLMVGRYHLTISVVSMDGMTDVLPRSLAFNIVESDVLGTGKFPPAKDGVLVTRGEWTLGEI